MLFGEGLLGSGGHITVNCAVEENRDVFAMPGDISNPNSQLPNILIEEGANVALGAAVFWRTIIGVTRRKRENRMIESIGWMLCREKYI